MYAGVVAVKVPRQRSLSAFRKLRLSGDGHRKSTDKPEKDKLMSSFGLYPEMMKETNSEAPSATIEDDTDDDYEIDDFSHEKEREKSFTDEEKK